MDPDKHMAPYGDTTSLIANYPLVPHTKPDAHALRQLAMQERAIRWLSFWRRACTKASVWQRSWPAGLPRCKKVKPLCCVPVWSLF